MNLTKKVSFLGGKKIMAERFYDLLAHVWIGIAGTDSRWVR
ncbi:hypothetical protein ACG3JJ_01625 [Streptococcus parauberis]|uniref:Uncharacterized protein n=3 Tax=Streptococcus parauberis TaxID=1348 RepID=A0A2I8AN83_9STRE|nr:hypothetical protein [Streptococcus parauberis]AUT06824.1 hypothetical protein SPSF3K_02132 [Streptococcus parauberis]EGE53647.1 hypothetical protein SPB_1989 [Streptococcus parauberis NCFD 2020]EMF48872.1 hypothetical protein SPJ2_1488 [Streptococcus parauberis KRS-02109]EMG24450.1 hypothetical protein SPJ1_2170 [Streptococcus parauberis KRS-02083]KYP18963.1 hypothetical protein AKL13_01535 [Streptococcus parauberis]